MTKRKLFTAAAAALVLCVCLAPIGSKPICSASAENKLDDFSEDFESYSVTGGFIETDAQFKQNWTNNVLKGGEPQGMDAHLTGIAKVEYEEGDAGNKVLHLNNAAVGQDSFFHIGPAGDYRTKNFTVGFRLKYLVQNVKERSWVGVSFRKKAEAHYTGTNNLLFAAQRYKDSTQVGGNAYAVINGGNTNDLGQAGTLELFKDVLETEYTVYSIPGAVKNEDTPWLDFKLQARGNNYKLFLDDEPLIDCTFNVPTYDYFGFLSLNCCTSNVLVDDFYVLNEDTELPPVIDPLPAPVLTWDAETRTVRWEKIDGANLYSVYINGELVKSSNRDYYQFEEETAAGEYEVRVKALSVDTFDALDSALSDPVTYTAGDRTSGGGCSGAMAGGLALVPLCLAAGLFLKRRK